MKMKAFIKTIGLFGFSMVVNAQDPCDKELWPKPQDMISQIDFGLIGPVGCAIPGGTTLHGARACYVKSFQKVYTESDLKTIMDLQQQCTIKLMMENLKQY